MIAFTTLRTPAGMAAVLWCPRSWSQRSRGLPSSFLTAKWLFLSHERLRAFTRRPCLDFPRSRSVHKREARALVEEMGRGQWEGASGLSAGRVPFSPWRRVHLLLPSPRHKGKNDSVQLSNTYCVQGTVFRALHALPAFTIPILQRHRNYYFPH